MPEPGTALATPQAAEESSTGAGDGLESKVIVYNCNCHTYQQVIKLFCEFIPGMNSTRAFELAWQIDHDGSAIVFAGEAKTAEEIAKLLSSGGLRVAVQ